MLIASRAYVLHQGKFAFIAVVEGLRIAGNGKKSRDSYRTDSLHVGWIDVCSAEGLITCQIALRNNMDPCERGHDQNMRNGRVKKPKT